MRKLIPALVLLLLAAACGKAAPTLPPEPATYKAVVENDIEFAQVSGRPLKLHIQRPDPTPGQPMPAVVWLHGGGWMMGPARPNPMAFLAEHGYFAASVEYRLTGEAVFPAQIEDAKGAVRWLRANAQKYHINPERIGAWGHSAGGHLAVLLGTSGDVKELEGSVGPPGYSSRVQAVVNLAGVIDLLNQPQLEWQVHERVKLVGGPLSEKRDKLKMASPATYITMDDPPVLSIHGTKDQNVPIYHSEFLHKALQEKGVESTFITLEGKDHWIIQYQPMGIDPETQEHVLAFFDKHLKRKK